MARLGRGSAEYVLTGSLFCLSCIAPLNSAITEADDPAPDISPALADRRESHPLLPTVSLTTLLADFTTSTGSPPAVAPSVPMAAPVAAGSTSSANMAAPDVFKPQPPLPNELAALEAKSPADTPGSGSGSAGDTPAAGAAPPRIAVQTPSSMALVPESEGSQPLAVSTSQAAAAGVALSQPPTADVGA